MEEDHRDAACARPRLLRNRSRRGMDHDRERARTPQGGSDKPSRDSWSTVDERNAFRPSPSFFTLRRRATPTPPQIQAPPPPAPRHARTRPVVQASLPATAGRPRDRKSVVEGKSVDLGGRRILKKQHRASVPVSVIVQKT